jgi:hypothetical protein
VHLVSCKPLPIVSKKNHVNQTLHRMKVDRSSEVLTRNVVLVLTVVGAQYQPQKAR